MKRSRVNEIIREADAFIRSFGYVMPPFAYWTPDELQGAPAAPASSTPGSAGTSPTTARATSTSSACSCSPCATAAPPISPRGSGMLYAEKIMISRKDQLSPMHRHDVKAEDIINRGGGTLVLELFSRDADGRHRPPGRGRACRPTA